MRVSGDYIMSEMFINTQAKGLKQLPENASVNFDANQLDWQDCGTEGFSIKPLLEVEGQTIRTWLMKVEPGAFSPLHAHTEVEQIYVMEGSFYDQEKTYHAGEFIVRAPGAMHTAGSEDGAVVLLIYF
jgi:anti-sigma factor ChrR (cupin superfamily)